MRGAGSPRRSANLVSAVRLLVLEAIALGLLISGSQAAAQHAATVPRLCFLTFDPGTADAPSPRFGAFFQGLRDLGYVPGHTLVLDYLHPAGRGERFPSLAAECVRVKADIIVASTTPAAQAAKVATAAIPIVMLHLGDPVGTGLVDSLARPGGNVTGTSSMVPAIAAKRLELLKEALPRLSRVLVLSYLVDPIASLQVKALEQAAPALGVALVVRDVRTADDLPTAFQAGARERVNGLLTTAESIFVANRAQVIQLAARHKVPGIYVDPSATVDGGGLMAYSIHGPALQVRTASYVDRILKGAKPAELAVEQPTKFWLAVNLKTARTLGLTIPPSLLARADQIVE
jgi:putative ABC transport system substrate-binding protein